MQVPNRRDQVTRGVGVPCRNATPVANVLLETSDKFGEKSSLVLEGKQDVIVKHEYPSRQTGYFKYI